MKINWFKLRNVDVIYMLWKYLILYSSSRYLAAFIIYLQQGWKCDDCMENYIYCKCNYCEKCYFNICLCKFKLKKSSSSLLQGEELNIRNFAKEFIIKNLSIANKNSIIGEINRKIDNFTKQKTDVTVLKNYIKELYEN